MEEEKFTQIITTKKAVTYIVDEDGVEHEQNPEASSQKTED